MSEKSNISILPSDYYIKNVNQLIPGDILLHPVYREDGLMLLARYTTLTSLFVEKINTHFKCDTPVLAVCSQEQLKKFIDTNMYSDKKFMSDLIDIVENFKKILKVPVYASSYIDERANLNINESTGKDGENYESLNRVISLSPLWNTLEKRLESERLQKRAKYIKNKFFNMVSEDKDMLELVNKMDGYESSLVINSINVLCISMLIGLTMELIEKDIINLCISALFCNIGYIRLDKKLYNNFIKNEEYTDLIKIHIKNSIEILCGHDSCKDKDIIYGILDHHEYCNGKGFPSRKEGKQISLFGRVLSIATTYEDLVGNFFNNNLTSNNAINIIWENKEKKFDQQILNVYMYRSNLYKIDQPVFFSYYGKGMIIGFSNYAEAPHKPIVKFINGKIIDYYLNT
jgi:HD-GYP domain-containing protein (c-di-GMP phosphodiesterase class II)